MTQGNQKKISKTASGDAAVARRVLQTEIEGLQALMQTIDGAFTQAVESIHVLKTGDRHGRLIVAGIGKSGHVARKIAATMASTSTPAFYVHPGEASHGDLGMVTESDIVLMLSNSGENPELTDLIHYTRRYRITLIAMTSNPDSTLAQHCNVCLLLPRAPEACPNGLAPTTSTTMMLALGDALAVALLERTGLTPEQFRAFHPGGKLGRKLMTVGEMMIPLRDMATVPDTARMDQALIALSEKNLGAVLVVDSKSAMKGIITDGDLKRHMAPDLLQQPVAAIMTKNPKTIDAQLLAVEALDIMTRVKGQYLTSLVVLRDGELAGLIRLQDCLQAGLA